MLAVGVGSLRSVKWWFGRRTWVTIVTYPVVNDIETVISVSGWSTYCHG